MLGRSSGYFQLTEGSLYPALHRLERQRLVSAYWEEVDGRRKVLPPDPGRPQRAGRQTRGVAGVRPRRQRSAGGRAGGGQWIGVKRPPADCPPRATMSRPACGKTSSTSWPTISTVRAAPRAVQEHHARGSDRQRQTTFRRSAGAGASTLGRRHEGHDHVEATHAGRNGIDDGDVSVVRMDRLDRPSCQSGNGRVDHSRRTAHSSHNCRRYWLPGPPPAMAGPERTEVHFHLICDDAQKSPAKGN